MSSFRQIRNSYEAYFATLTRLPLLPGLDTLLHFRLCLRRAVQDAPYRYTANPDALCNLDGAEAFSG